MEGVTEDGRILKSLWQPGPGPLAIDSFFSDALHEDLGEFRQHPQLTLLQYVDDLLIAAKDQQTCLMGTQELLRTLGKLGY